MKPEGCDINTFLKSYLTYGEYEHKGYHPVKDFLSGLLDITIIKPVVECVIGKDLITGEDLNDLERGMKLVGATVDLFTLGQAMVLTSGAGLGGKGIAKVLMVEMASNAAAYSVSYGSNELGAPVAVTWALSMLTGCVVSKTLNGYLFEDAYGTVREYTQEEIDEILRKLERLGSEGGTPTTKPKQVHHYATNKSKTYTPQLEEIAKKYGLDLDDAWNKDLLPHQGRHPNAYHEYVLDSMKQFDDIAQGDQGIFLKLFDNLKNNVKSNPDMLYKDYWK